ncbi:MAG: adenylate/guanylate cyclase domain-containing protein [Solirubrobacterales bacterium]
MEQSRPRRVFEGVVNHPWLIGDPDASGETIMGRTRWMVRISVALANIVGAVVVTAFAAFVLPKPGVGTEPVVVNAAAAGAYLFVALVVGLWWGAHRLEGGDNGVAGWLCSEGAPTDAQRQVVIRAPTRIMVVQLVLWGVAVGVFATLNSFYDGLLGLGVGLTTMLGGLTTSATAYLLTELSVRPVAARMFSYGTVPADEVRSVTARWVLAWSLGTGIPLLGLVAVGIVALTPVEISEQELALTLVVLGGIALIFGANVAFLASFATTHPIRATRRGLGEVSRGNLDTDVRVWDTTEVGLLQAGFNEMVTGLRERERIRDLFGRHVGEEVAERAMDQELTLGGETRHVTVLFVDIVGSTAMATERPPQKVVEVLNRFFAEVVDGVESCGGWINKFEGDAALAIFGAPIELDDPEGRALEAARTIDERLRAEVTEIEAGIGVACGKVVAGNIGAESRFEYTVIGDPVNEAARLSDHAKEVDGWVLASAKVLDRAEAEEADRWELGEDVTLRGRDKATKLAAPKQGDL